MNALVRAVMVRVVWTLILLVLAGLFWILVGFVTSSPESAAKNAVTIATQSGLLPGSFHVLKVVPYPAGQIVVYTARVRATGHHPAMEITGEQAVDERFGHWAGSAGGWGGPVSHDPKDIANISQTAFFANDRSMYAVVVVRPLSPRARTLNLTYKDGHSAHFPLRGQVLVTVSHTPRVCSLTISDSRGKTVWPLSRVPSSKRAAVGSCPRI